MGQMFGKNSRAVVGHGNQSVASCRNDRLFAMNIVVIQDYVGSFDPQVTALRHRVARIGGQVHQNLLDLQRIHAHLAQSFAA